MEGTASCIPLVRSAMMTVDPRLEESMTTLTHNMQRWEENQPVYDGKDGIPIFRRLPFLLQCSKCDSLLI